MLLRGADLYEERRAGTSAGASVGAGVGVGVGLRALGPVRVKVWKKICPDFTPHRV